MIFLMELNQAFLFSYCAKELTMRFFSACTSDVLDKQNIPATELAWAVILFCKYAFWQIIEPVVHSVSCPLS